MSRRRSSVRGTLNLLRRWAVVSGRDAVATTRESLLSVEARAGALVLLVLALLSWGRAEAWYIGGPEEEEALLGLVGPWGGVRGVFGRGGVWGGLEPVSSCWGGGGWGAGGARLHGLRRPLGWKGLGPVAYALGSSCAGDG